MSRRLAIGAMAIAVVLPAGPGLAQDRDRDRDRLEGWGPFKFSMSRAQAIEAIKPAAYFYGSPVIGYDTEIDGAKWHAVVEFSDDQSAITKIRLQQGTIAALMGRSTPIKETATKEVCLSRVGRLEPQVTKRHGAPDRTVDHTETSAPPYFYRDVRYDFKDGGHIDIIAAYSPPPASGKKDDAFCDVTIQYFPFRAVPKSTL